MPQQPTGPTTPTAWLRGAESRQPYRLAALTAALLLSSALVFGWQSWRTVHEEQEAQLTNVLAVVQVVLNRYLAELSSGLHTLAGELVDSQGRLVDANRAQALLANFQKQKPDLSSASLRSMEGDFLAISRVETLSAAPPSESFANFRRSLPTEDRLELGRPVLSRVSKRWVVPLRLVVRSAQGEPVGVLAAALPVEFLQSFWQDAPLVHRASIGLLGDDGFLRSRYPVPASVSPEVTYGRERRGALREHLLATGFPAAGYVEGDNQLGGESFGNAYRRLPTWKATLFVAMPTREFAVVWWRQVRVPFALLAVLSLVGLMGMRQMLRRQAQWALERRHADEALAHSENRYRRLFESGQDAIFLVDEGGHVLRANPAAARLFGVSEAELCLRGCDSLLDSQDPRLALLAQQRQAHGHSQGLATALRADGSRFEAEISSAAYADGDGRPLVSVSVRDVSLQQQAEAALREKALAEQASHAKSAFIARMSHELRTPLNAILGFAEVMQVDTRHSLHARQQQQLAQIRSSGRHLLALINDLLDLSRIEGGHLQVRWEEVELGDVVREAIDEVMHDARLRHIGLALREDNAAVPAVRGDRTRLLQVVLNLLSNAIKYNHDGGRVDVRLTLHAGQVRLVVRDTGIGMDAAQVNMLYHPFNRLGRETTEIKGTGIGLVITRSLVELMGGQLQVTSVPGEGCEFTVDWPPARAEWSADAAADAEPQTAAPRAAATRSDVAGSVIYIDDDEVNRLLMQAFLSLRPAVQLGLAASGAAGLALAQAQPPRLLLVDLMMPGMSGREVLAALRAQPALQHVPCVAVSANAMPEDIEQALAAGFDSYLTKPLAATVLLAEVDRWLLRAPHTGAVPLPLST